MKLMTGFVYSLGCNENRMAMNSLPLGILLRLTRPVVACNVTVSTFTRFAQISALKQLHLSANIFSI
jgi:hypothetical protein